MLQLTDAPGHATYATGPDAWLADGELGGRDVATEVVSLASASDAADVAPRVRVQSETAAALEALLGQATASDITITNRINFQRIPAFRSVALPGARLVVAHADDAYVRSSLQQLYSRAPVLPPVLLERVRADEWEDSDSSVTDGPLPTLTDYLKECFAGVTRTDTQLLCVSDSLVEPSSVDLPPPPPLHAHRTVLSRV